MQIQTVGNGAHVPHWVKFVGFIKDGSVLTTLPFDEGKGMWMQQGQTFLLRGFNGRYAYSFTSQVLRARADPLAYIHFSWPREVAIQVVRHSLRVDVTLPVNVICVDNSTVATTLHDVSISGAKLDSKEEFGAVGDQVHVELLVGVDGNTMKMNIPAIIRNIHQAEGGKGFNTGVEFEKISQNDRLILNYFINSVMQPRSMAAQQ